MVSEDSRLAVTVGDDGRVELAVDPPPDGAKFEFYIDDEKKEGPTDQPSWQSASPLEVGTHRVAVTWTLPGGERRREDAKIVIPASPPADGGAGDVSPVIIWRPLFAGVAAVVVALVTSLAAWTIIEVARGWSFGEPAYQLAGFTSTVLLVAGLVIVAVGVWMLAVELRGRLRSAADVDDVIQQARSRGVEPAAALASGLEAFGKLSGPAAVLVAGIVPLVAAAWIAASAVTPAAEEQPTADTATESPTATATTPADTATP